MAAGSTYTPIATTTLGSSVASYTFSSIPQTYTDLVLIIGAQTSRSTTQDTIVAQFNSDTTTSNYSETFLSGNGSSASSSRLGPSSPYLGIVAEVIGANGSSSEFGSNRCNIMNYSNSTTYKTWLSRADVPNSFTETIAGLWRSTAAITSITLKPILGNNLLAGSTFTLYGIAAA